MLISGGVDDRNNKPWYATNLRSMYSKLRACGYPASNIFTFYTDGSDPLDLDKCGYFGSECDGGFAAYTKVDARNVHPVDSDLSHAELATFATSYVTAENMLNRANVGGDEVQLAYRRWAETQLQRYQEALTDFGKEARVRVAGLFRPDRGPMGRNVVRFET